MLGEWIRNMEQQYRHKTNEVEKMCGKGIVVPAWTNGKEKGLRKRDVEEVLEEDGSLIPSSLSLVHSDVGPYPSKGPCLLCPAMCTGHHTSTICLRMLVGPCSSIYGQWGACVDPRARDGYPGSQGFARRGPEFSSGIVDQGLWRFDRRCSCVLCLVGQVVVAFTIPGRMS